MAILIYCPTCKSTYELDSKECSKCGKPFSRDKKYRVFVDMKGRRVTRVVDNLTMARDAETAIKADLLREEFDITKYKKVPTLADVWKKYLPWAKENKKSWKDDEWYYNKHIGPRFGGKKLDSISPLEIERLKIEMKRGESKNGRPYAPKTIKIQLEIIRRLYNLARKWRLYDGANPINSVEIPKIDNQVTEYLTDEQLRNLFEVLETWPFRDNARFIKFALLTGLRRGEIFKLKRDDVDFERGLVTIRDPKGGVTETLPLNKAAMTILEDLEVTSPLVFPGPGGRQRKSIRETWGSVKKHAGLPADFRFHGLRHNWASRLVSAGYDLAVVQKLLSHKHASTTARYAHLRPDVVKEAALNSEALLTPRKPGEVIEIRRKK